MATTKEIRTWMEDYLLISDLIMKITRDAKAFQCHPDKFDEAVDHAATFIFEWLFMSIFKSVPGYALEKFLNHGSRELRTKLSDPEESFGEIAAELEDIKLEDIHRLQTWATQESATWEHGNLHGDNKTKAGLTSMIREKAGGYLQRHFCKQDLF